MADDRSCGTWMIILMAKKWRQEDTARREHALFAQGQGLSRREWEGSRRVFLVSLVHSSPVKEWTSSSKQEIGTN